VKPAECTSADSDAEKAECARFRLSFSKTSADYVDIEMMVKLGDDTLQYGAMGLSSDGQMGGDKVTECVFNKTSGSADVSVSENMVYGKSNKRIQDQSGDVQMVESGQANGYWYCHIRQRIQPKNTNLDALDKSYYILMAVGPATDTGIKYHKTHRWASPEQLTLTQYAAASTA